MPRATTDFDFIINLEEKNIDGFIQHFQEGYYCDKDAVQHALKRRSMFNIIYHASGFKAGFMVLKEGAFRQEGFNRRKKVDFFDKTIYVISPEDLLISKLIWIQDFQSLQQMEDIKNLAVIEQLDRPYITKWIDTLKLKSFNLLKHE